MTLVGTLKHSQVEGGVWLLEDSDGVTYQLVGAPASQLTHGAKVEVEGEVDENAMSFAMSGPLLKVKRITKK